MHVERSDTIEEKCTLYAKNIKKSQKEMQNVA
jgi:hypothetical protein